MQQAQREVVIISPYFVPGPRMMAVPGTSAARRARVLTNSMASNDAPAAHAGYARYREALLNMGVELYEMRSDPETAVGSAARAAALARATAAAGSAAASGGSKAATGSRASLHSKP
jgi:phosphatidylserine/phosphatidylglycerophosphate/cardiolipin synthase-like enzyme